MNRPIAALRGPLVALAVLAASGLLSLDADAGPGRAADLPRPHRVELTAATKTINGSILSSPAKNHGVVFGRPFGSGKIKLRIQLDLVYRTATGTFRIRNDRGTAVGTLDMEISGHNRLIDFDGTAEFTGGRGRYKGIGGTGLTVQAQQTLDDPNGTLSLSGRVSW